MQFEKRCVPLSAIRPSGTNPREDMGDIGALADAIRATGGEPVNPPVVVADGNVWRIVDGERRYRALSEIYADEPDREVAVLEAASMGDADELAAMLATDDKKALTEAERGRGVQQMMLLGVDEVRVARASRATPQQLAAARELAPRVPAGAQVSLDQMVAALEFEDEADREAVLSAGTAWSTRRYEIRRRIDRERRARSVDRALASAGVERRKFAPDGWVRVGEFYDSSSIASIKQALGRMPEGPRVAVEEGGWRTLLFAPEGSEAPGDPGEAARERERDACRDLMRRVCLFAMGGGLQVCPELRDAAIEARDLDTRDEEVDEAWAAWSAGMRGVSAYEMVMALVEAAFEDIQPFTRPWYSGAQRAGAARRLLDAVDLARLCGFETEERDGWLLERARDAADGGASDE